MPIRHLVADALELNEDWEGNNVAIACPVCHKVYLVSEMIHQGERSCPRCGKSIARVMGGKKSGGSAHVEWRDQVNPEVHQGERT